MAKKKNPIVDTLIRAYNAEIETIMNYIANAENLDGVRAKQISEALLQDVPAELGHAQGLAKRIKTIDGMVPGSFALEWSQKKLQPSADTTDVVAVIKGVIDAEEGAIALYQEIIKLCEGKDYASQDLAIKNLADEEEHLREFRGFLREYEKLK